MHVCIPVEDGRGPTSPIAQHFGSAPFFLIADTEGGEPRTVANEHAHHGGGACRPLGAVPAFVEAVVVGGIGRGALAHLRNAGLAVYAAPPGTAGEALEALRRGTLPEVRESTCAGRGHGHGHGHEHGHGGGCGGHGHGGGCGGHRHREGHGH